MTLIDIFNAAAVQVANTTPHRVMLANDLYEANGILPDYAGSTNAATLIAVLLLDSVTKEYQSPPSLSTIGGAKILLMAKMQFAESGENMSAAQYAELGALADSYVYAIKQQVVAYAPVTSATFAVNEWIDNYLDINYLACSLTITGLRLTNVC